MAVPLRGQVYATAWEDYVKTKPEDQIFNHFWLLENLRTGNSFRKGNGRIITGTIEYAQNPTVKAMGEMDSLDLTRGDFLDVYEYAYKFVGGLFVMSEFEKQATAGDGGKLDLDAAKMDNLKKSMFSNISAQCYGDGSGTGGFEAGGLALLVSATPTTGTRGGISSASFTFWRSQQTSGAKTSTAFDNVKPGLRSLYNLQSSGVGYTTPEFAVGDRASFEGYEAVCTTNERLNRSAVTDKLLSGYKGDHIMFKDVPFAFDFGCTAAAIYLLNKTNLFIRYMLWMKAFPPASPVNQFVDAVKIYNIFNLCTDNPRRLGVLTGIT